MPQIMSIFHLSNQLEKDISGNLWKDLTDLQEKPVSTIRLALSKWTDLGSDLEHSLYRQQLTNMVC